MSVKEYLIRILSLRTKYPIRTIEAIVDHQMEGANGAMKEHFSVELSGFGKFVFNHRKAYRKLEKQYSKIKVFEEILKRPDLTEAKKKSYELKLENTYKTIEELKPIIERYENKRGTGGVEKPTDPSGGAEITDRGDILEQDRDMQTM